MEAPLNQVLADKMVRKQQPGPLRKQFSYILRKEEGVVKQTENDAFRQGVENFQIRQFLASYSRLFCSSQSYRIQPCEKTNRSSGTEGHIVLPLHLLLVFWFFHDLARAVCTFTGPGFQAHIMTHDYPEGIYILPLAQWACYQLSRLPKPSNNYFP